MKRSRRLQTLVRLAAAVERRARIGLGNASQDLARKQQQTGQLESYEQEYSARWIERGRGGMSAGELATMTAFRSSLARIIDVQRNAVAAARTERAQQAQRWSRERNRLQAMERLVERASDAERRVAERLEQRATDDLRRRPRDEHEQ